MSYTNPYFTNGVKNEQYLIEDLIIESLKIYGQEMRYIPRKLVAKDDILGEDRLSKFEQQFPIEMYFENVDSLEGQGAFIQKFGLMMEQSATLVVSKRRWEQMVGRHGATQVPGRPNEGDLIYFPLAKKLFEIKFVQHEDPFYQLGKLYVYKLQVELFQYASEAIDTGDREIDNFETLKTFNTNITRTKYGSVTGLTLLSGGSGYTSAPTVSFVSSSGKGATAVANLGTGTAAGTVVSYTITNGGSGYTSVPTVTVTGGGGSGAGGIAVVSMKNIDSVEDYGDNEEFKTEGSAVRWTEENPFGEVQ